MLTKNDPICPHYGKMGCDGKLMGAPSNCCYDGDWRECPQGIPVMYELGLLKV